MEDQLNNRDRFIFELNGTIAVCVEFIFYYDYIFLIYKIPTSSCFTQPKPKQSSTENP